MIEYERAKVANVKITDEDGDWVVFTAPDDYQTKFCIETRDNIISVTREDMDGLIDALKGML